MKPIRPIFWLLLGAFFLFFTGGKFNVWPLAWFSGLFLLRYMREGKFLRRFGTLLLVNWIIILITWYGIQPSDPLSYGISMLVGTLFSSLPLVADRLLHKRVPAFAATLVFPVFATALEFFFITGNPMGSFGSLAYTQFGNLPFIQLVSLTGLMGPTFMMNWFATVGNHLWERKREGLSLGRTAVVFLTVMVAIYGYGLIRISLPDHSEKIQVAGIFKPQGDISLLSILQKPDMERKDSARVLVESYLEKTEEEADLGASLISWPEGAVLIDSDDYQHWLDRISVIADELDIYLVVPFFIIHREAPFENKLHIFDPHGKVALTHVKYGGNVFEGSEPGSGIIESLETEYGRLAAVICWDMDFPSPLLQTGKQGVDILFSPANEWSEIIPVHGQMAVFRGIENGSSTVHPATSGFSIIADPLGRALASENWFDSDRTAIRAQVPREGRKTIYSLVGDLFPSLLMVAMVLLLFYGIFLIIKSKIQKRRSRVNAIQE